MQTQAPNKTKVLFIQPGYGHYRFPLYDMLHKNHDVTFVFIRSEQMYPSRLLPNPEWNKVFLDCTNSAFWVLKLAKLIVTIRPHVIISSINGSCQTVTSVIMGRILQIPVILWSISWDTSRFDSGRPYWRDVLSKRVVKWTTRNADAIVAGGKKSKKFNKKMAPAGKLIFTAYQSTGDLSLMTGIHTRAANKINHIDGITVLYFSRIVEYKGLDILIHAFSEIEKGSKHARLVVAGDGPFREYCESLSRRLAVENITFYGGIQNEDAREFYKEADIFVLPCSGKNGTEAWGLVLNEATSMGLPIVTTDAVGAAGDLVEDGINGYVVRAGSASALRRAIEKLMADEDERQRMGRESRRLFESINSYKKMYEGFNSAIHEVVTDHHRQE